MAKKILVINDECLVCGACMDECPVGAISLAKDGSKYVIDKDICIRCGACFNKCPASAIKETDE